MIKKDDLPVEGHVPPAKVLQHAQLLVHVEHVVSDSFPERKLKAYEEFVEEYFYKLYRYWLKEK
jgi:hypothetical protein